MRRSSRVQLTLLPLLASAAMAHADTITDNPPPVDEPIVQAPGMTEPVLAPPGMVEPVRPTCREDPSLDPNLPDCPPRATGHHIFSGVIRGGFGGYFGAGGGG
jgi:hypothetical protein